MNRRELLKTVAAGAAALALHPAMSFAGEEAVARFAALEHKHGGRLGVAVLNTASGRCFTHRGDERFLICSTFKLLLVAAVLKRIDDGVERLDRRIVFDKDALLEYAPITKQHAGPPGMAVAQLLQAAIIWSDNTAANLLLASMGGPVAVTGFARSLGDQFTQVDRIEPALNPYDTTTPNAMLRDMQALLLGDALSQSSRGKLIRWMMDCRTGLQSLRAGMPAGWRIGDKTGQWDGDGRHANNDIAIAWPPRRKPMLVTAYYMTDTADPAARKEVLADMGRIVAAM
ncbi:MAG TPA: class A beta-lactamase [Rhodanobacteraceae bacterium]